LSGYETILHNVRDIDSRIDTDNSGRALNGMCGPHDTIQQHFIRRVLFKSEE
jgi:hypothetical protein